MRHYNYTCATSALLIGLVGFGLSSPARAQDPGAQATTLDEIIVTATRSGQSLTEVPMAVNVATGEQLEKLNIFDFKDVEQLAPGLELTNSDGRSNIATLRGITFSPDSGVSPAVDIYFNEFPIDAQTAFTAIYDVGQIEVLRGPQGLLRGRTSPAGAITLVTRAPDLTRFEGYLQATASDQNATNIQGGVSIPLVEDRLGVRLAAMDDRNDVNGVRSAASGEESESRTRSYRVSLLAKPNDDVTFNLTYQHLEQELTQYIQVIGSGAVLPTGQLPSVDFASNGPVAGAGDRVAVSDGPGQYDNDSDLLTMQADWDLGWGTLSLTAGHQDALLTQTRDLDVGNLLPTRRDVQVISIPYDTSNIELRLSSNGEGAFGYMVGLNYYETTSNSSLVQENDQLISGLPAALLGLPPELGVISTFPLYSVSEVDVLIDLPAEVTTKSVFGSVRYDVNDQLTLSGGLRFSRYDTYQQSFLTVIADGVNVLDALPTLPADQADKTDDAITGGANASYRLNDSLNAYVSYGHSYRAGAVAVGNTAPLEDRLVVTQPEESDAYELGIKGDLFDGLLNMTANVFYQTFDGYIGRTADIISMSSARNGVIDASLQLNYNADVDVKGVEVQFWAQPVEAWDIGLSASYSDAKLKDAEIPCNVYDGNGQVVVPIGEQASFCTSDGKVADVSPFEMSLTSEYRFQVASVEPFVRGIFTYSPGFDSDIIDYEYDDLPLLNLFVGVRNDAGWELSVFARNVFDVDRIRSISGASLQRQTVVLNPDFSLGGGPALDSGYRQVTTNRPREFGVTLRASF